jgi:hypothetical protein
MKRNIIILLILIFFTSGISGQKVPIKFGEVSMEDLKMVTYPLDTSASAVILCDYGYFDHLTFQFTRIVRIKIFRKEGYSWANRSYSGNSKPQIKGITFNLDNGKITESKLKGESVFTDRITDNYYVTRIAMPNVKEGSVIDLQFFFDGIPYQWRFQELIPVKYSELILSDTPDIRFRYSIFGNEPLAISTPNRWVAINIPSIKEEPYMTSVENYLTKLDLDILDVVEPTHPIMYYSMVFKSLTDSWESVSKILMDDINFGKTLSGSMYLNNLAGKIEKTSGSPEDKLKMAYDSLKSVVKWNEKIQLFTSSGSLGSVYKLKIGNSADINLLLLQLLSRLKFDVAPVIISTRAHGFLSPAFPSIHKPDYVIVRAKIGNKSYLLDATEPFMPYYLLPIRCLSNSGILVDKINSSLVELKTQNKEKDFTTYQLKILDNNTIEGKLMIKSLDYGAQNVRKKYHSFNSSDEYLEDFGKNKQGLTISKSEINNIDNIYQPLIEDYDVTMNNQVNIIGNEIYLLPMFYNQLKSNPFELDNRKFPVDFGYNIEKTVTTTLEIPDKYIASDLPSPVIIKLQDNEASLTYFVELSENKIIVKSIFSINKSMFLPSEYTKLKEFYNQVIKKHAEPIILKKK